MPVAQGSVPDPTECYLCGAVFSEANPPTRSHVIARRWFGTPPPENLPTLPACSGCNNDLSPREERLRNALVRVFSHDAGAHRQVFEKAARSRQHPSQATWAGYNKTTSGLFAPSVLLELPNTVDVETVFRGITRGLYYKMTGQLMPQHVPVRSLILQAQDANRLTQKTIELTRGVFTYGEQFSFAPVINGANLQDSVWLYLVFNAVVVASFTGEASQLQFPPARVAFAHPRS